MTALVLSLVLSALNCGPQDQKKFPHYCYCVVQARASYKQCSEAKHITKCSVKHQDDIRYCERNFKGK